jgi:cytochrome c5
MSSSALAPAAVGATRIDQIFGSPSGDVWAMVGGKLARYTIPMPAPSGGGGAGAGDAAWSAQIAPVFARVCAHCHLPDGTSGVDLSTAALWAGERAEIGKRVVVQKSMPPAGTAMTDADRATIAAWAGAGAK